jgi:predicted dehydrogenase
VLGEVHAIQGTIAKRFLDPHDIRNDPDAGGGALYDLGSYVISACNLILGRPPLRVVAAMERDPEFRVDRLSTALLDYGDAHASFTAATQSGTSARGTHQQLSVLGSEGWLRCDFPLPAPVRRAATSTWATRRASAPSRRGRPRRSR